MANEFDKTEAMQLFAVAEQKMKNFKEFGEHFNKLDKEGQAKELEWMRKTFSQEQTTRPPMRGKEEEYSPVEIQSLAQQEQETTGAILGGTIKGVTWPAGEKIVENIPSSLGGEKIRAGIEAQPLTAAATELITAGANPLISATGKVLGGLSEAGKTITAGSKAEAKVLTRAFANGFRKQPGAVNSGIALGVLGTIATGDPMTGAAFGISGGLLHGATSYAANKVAEGFAGPEQLKLAKNAKELRRLQEHIKNASSPEEGISNFLYEARGEAASVIAREKAGISALAKATNGKNVDFVNKSYNMLGEDFAQEEARIIKEHGDQKINTTRTVSVVKNLFKDLGLFDKSGAIKKNAKRVLMSQGLDPKLVDIYSKLNRSSAVLPESAKGVIKLRGMRPEDIDIDNGITEVSLGELLAIKRELGQSTNWKTSGFNKRVYGTILEELKTAAPDAYELGQRYKNGLNAIEEYEKLFSGDNPINNLRKIRPLSTEGQASNYGSFQSKSKDVGGIKFSNKERQAQFLGEYARVTSETEGALETMLLNPVLTNKNPQEALALLYKNGYLSGLARNEQEAVVMRLVDKNPALSKIVKQYYTVEDGYRYLSELKNTKSVADQVFSESARSLGISIKYATAEAIAKLPGYMRGKILDIAIKNPRLVKMVDSMNKFYDKSGGKNIFLQDVLKNSINFKRITVQGLVETLLDNAQFSKLDKDMNRGFLLKNELDWKLQNDTSGIDIEEDNNVNM